MCSVKISHLFTLMLILCCYFFYFVVWAEESDDFVMGNYQGTITGKAWEGKSLRAQVAAQGNGRYRCVFLFTQGNEPEQRVEIKGMKTPLGAAGVMEPS
jgi:hypothetical protein